MPRRPASKPILTHTCTIDELYPCSQPMNTKPDPQPAELSAEEILQYSLTSLLFHPLATIFLVWGKHFLSLSGRARIKTLRSRISCLLLLYFSNNTQLPLPCSAVFENYCPKVWIFLVRRSFKRLITCASLLSRTLSAKCALLPCLS